MSIEKAATHELIVLHASDNVAVARVALAEDTDIARSDGSTFRVREPVAAGHKIALRDIAPGEVILKYGQPIGVASIPIAAGRHVHVHNIGMSLSSQGCGAQHRLCSNGIGALNGIDNRLRGVCQNLA